MKKILPFLILGIIILASCRKDTSTKLSISSGDLSVINAQLKGTWLFPVESVTTTDASGNIVAPTQTMASNALQFDGSSGLTILPDPQTAVSGTYTLSNDKGSIYLNIFYPGGTPLKYQILVVNNQSLILTNTNNTNIAAAKATATLQTSKITYKRQNSADATAHLVRVFTNSDSMFNVSVWVTHGVNITSYGNVAKLLDSAVNVPKSYNYSFVAKPGDHLTVNLNCYIPKTTFSAYYNGVPLNGQWIIANNQMQTSTGWNIPDTTMLLTGAAVPVIKW